MLPYVVGIIEGLLCRGRRIRVAIVERVEEASCMERSARLVIDRKVWSRVADADCATGAIATATATVVAGCFSACCDAIEFVVDVYRDVQMPFPTVQALKLMSGARRFEILGPRLLPCGIR